MWKTAMDSRWEVVRADFQRATESVKMRISLLDSFVSGLIVSRKWCQRNVHNNYTSRRDVNPLSKIIPRGGQKSQTTTSDQCIDKTQIFDMIKDTQCVRGIRVRLFRRA
mmetsp:Transcript_22833/g.33348  ORF Transcript_22833/g.33348 Transcript_22833/m.33348 type:complete len:109 (+) Transcript_22833:94-420(+)